MPQNKVTLCHGDCGPTNMIRTAQGIYLIDFETLRLDLRAYDLYRMIYNCCQDHGWNFAIVKSILNGYQKVRKLRHADIQMLKVRLHFPRQIYLLIKPYDRQSSKGKLEIERNFLRVLASERRRRAMIKQLDQYARNRNQ